MKSKSIKRVGWQLILAAIVALVATTFAFAPAQAAPKPPAVAVIADDGTSVATCKFKPTSASVAKGTARGSLRVSVKPFSSKGAYKKFAHVYVDCGLFDSTYTNYLDGLAKDDNDGGVTGSKSKVVALDTSYNVCLSVTVVYKDGNIPDSVFGQCS